METQNEQTYLIRVNSKRGNRTISEVDSVTKDFVLKVIRAYPLRYYAIQLRDNSINDWIDPQQFVEAMKANEVLSELRAAAVRMVTATVPNEIADLSAYERLSLRVTTYRASNVRASEFTLYGAHIEDIKAVVWCALHRTPAPLFEVEIYTDEYNRPLLRVDSEKVGYEKAIQTLADYFKQASKPTNQPTNIRL